MLKKGFGLLVFAVSVCMVLYGLHILRIKKRSAGFDPTAASGTFDQFSVYEDFPIDLTELMRLETYGDPPLAQALEKRYAVIVYLNDLSCTTCVNSTLDFMNQMYDNYRHQLGFVAIVHGYQPDYLRALRRVGKVEYPILIEYEKTKTGLPDERNISLLDLSNNTVKMTFFPETSNTHLLPELERYILREIVSTL